MRGILAGWRAYSAYIIRCRTRTQSTSDLGIGFLSLDCTFAVEQHRKTVRFEQKKKNIDRNNDFLVWFHSKLSSWKWFNCSTDKWCKIQGRSTISINPLKCGSVCSTAKVRGNSILFYFLGDARKWLRLRRLETTSLETHLSPSRVAIQ